jgi:hypothetical protein
MNLSSESNRLLSESAIKQFTHTDADDADDEVNQRNELKLKYDLGTKLEYILQEFGSIGIENDDAMYYVISHALNSCGQCTKLFLNWSGFMQNKICKSDEKLKFSVFNPQTYDRDLYAERRTSDGYVLIKKFEIDAEVESFNIVLRGNHLLLFDYYAKIWQKLFNISPAFALERAIEVGIDEIDCALIDDLSIDEVFEIILDCLNTSINLIKGNNDALDFTIKRVFTCPDFNHEEA